MTPITNSIIKQVSALGVAKHRRAEQLFVAEGTRCVTELLPLLKCRMLIATEEWLTEHKEQGANAGDIYVATEVQIKKMSQQQSPQPVLAVFDMPHTELDLNAVVSSELVLALDSVRDPGNMGTIVRLADWYGIKHILCSTDTVDVYNPKVVQATMGAIGRVSMHYINLAEALAQIDAPVYGTFLDGDNIYQTTLTPTGVIVMGNEANGISAQVAQRVDHRLFIPPYPPAADTVESLNVGVAAAITVSEFRRRLLNP
ncbi:MAG: RNA methyltransferase [Muribaculaceae bacterium]|nr:RNA methyltransferase [Muribaculaceae bacterium]